jgi:hypothetical protein
MIPPILYKYREDSQFTEDVLRNLKIWLSSPEQLNDPLECKTGIIPEDWKQRTIQMMEAAQIMGLVDVAKRQETLFSLDRRKTKLWLRRLKKLPHDARIKEMRTLQKKHGIELSDPRKIFEGLQKQLSSIGIFSLTEIANNQPLWAHYAKNHTGLALGFSASPDSNLGNARHTLRVKYSADKPIFKEGFLQEIQCSPSLGGQQIWESRISLDDLVYRASISTKPPAWSYEQKWRYIEDTGGLHDFPGKLVSLTFGCRMPEERRENYKNLIEQLGMRLDLFQVYVSPDGSLELQSIAPRS